MNEKLGTGEVWQGDGESLHCPECNSLNLKVRETRHHRGTVRRRRQCLRCDHRFYTKEVVCDMDLRPPIKSTYSTKK